MKAKYDDDERVLWTVGSKWDPRWTIFSGMSGAAAYLYPTTCIAM